MGNLEEEPTLLLTDQYGMSVLGFTTVFRIVQQVARSTQAREAGLRTALISWLALSHPIVSRKRKLLRRQLPGLPYSACKGGGLWLSGALIGCGSPSESVGRFKGRNVCFFSVDPPLSCSIRISCSSKYNVWHQIKSKFL